MATGFHAARPSCRRQRESFEVFFQGHPAEFRQAQGPHRSVDILGWRKPTVPLPGDGLPGRGAEPEAQGGLPADAAYGDVRSFCGAVWQPSQSFSLRQSDYYWPKAMDEYDPPSDGGLGSCLRATCRGAADRHRPLRARDSPLRAAPGASSLDPMALCPKRF